MHVVRGWSEGLEIDERAPKESEMIGTGIEEDECGSMKQLKIACNSVVNEEAVLR